MNIINKWIEQHGQESYECLFDYGWSVYELTFRHIANESTPIADNSSHLRFLQGVDYWNSNNVISNCERIYYEIIEGNGSIATKDEWSKYYEKYCSPFVEPTISRSICETFRERNASMYGDCPIDKLNVPQLLSILLPAFPKSYKENDVRNRAFLKSLSRTYGDSDIKTLYEGHYGEMTSDWNTMIEAEHNPKTDSYRFKFICPVSITKLLKTIGLLYKSRLSISKVNFMNTVPSDTNPRVSGYMNNVSLFRLGNNDKDYSYSWYLSLNEGLLEARSDSDFFPNYMFTPFEEELIIAKIRFATRSIKIHNDSIDRYNEGIKLLSAFMDSHKNACINEYVREGA